MNDLVLPVVHCAVPLEFLVGVVLILDVHPGVVRVVPDLELAEFLSK